MSIKTMILSLKDILDAPEGDASKKWQEIAMREKIRQAETEEKIKLFVQPYLQEKVLQSYRDNLKRIKTKIKEYD